ncbi:ATP-dependent RNA helicase [Pseudonocardia sp. Ae717_Ps2]|uniref:DEAD/DEAH box helicase n=1 Tax=Pseudonocardia sp. Ae717_Ps2 TaxID=1885573 RepID=UPI00095B6B85|nr:ATP-dependent RNA helicase [Pseudonocardia sp. Ae717_Ps2]
MTRPQFRPPSSDAGTATDRPARRRATRPSGPSADGGAQRGSTRRDDRRTEFRSETRGEFRGEDRRDRPARDDDRRDAARPARGARTGGPARGERSGAPRGERTARGERSGDGGTGNRAERREHLQDGSRVDRGPARSSQRNGDRPASRRGRRGGGGGGNGGAASRPAAARAAVAAPKAEPEPQWVEPEDGMPSFAALGLPERLTTALAEQGFTAPFPVQAATLPDTLAGRDLLGRGQTGSGKTLAFGLALLARLAGERSRPTAPRGLVLVPTRELATQVVEVLKPLAKAVDLRVTDIVGGMSMNKQVAELRRGIDLLVATPGRLSDHLQQRTCDLSEVTITALDEADRMADMGFLPQVRAILDRTPADGQRLLFSATLDGDVDTLVRRHLTDPVTRSVAPPTGSVATMEHHVLVVDRDDRPRVVAEIAAREGRTILFVRTKHGADRMVRVLRREGVAAGPLHGGRSQSQRNRALDDFRSGAVPVLVATDVAARGIHIDDVGLVVHVDPPADPKAYLHRAGRTARAGEDGVVVTLAMPEQRAEVDLLTRQAGVSTEVSTVRPGHPDLVRVTGAQEPSGEPIIVAKPPKPTPRRRPAAGGAARSDRPRRRR